MSAGLDLRLTAVHAVGKLRRSVRRRRSEITLTILGTMRALMPGLLVVLLAAAAPAHAAPDPAARCEALARSDFSATQDAPFAVTAATVVADSGNAAFCKVAGYVAPEVSFEMRLPLAAWNHGFALVGSGGWANYKFVFLCKVPLERNYACIAGDAGHAHAQGLWMQANAQARIDWGYLATHKLALAGKALARAFYGDSPRLSLMLGCSTGGYQSLVEAQRFPWDFAGVIAIAPDIDEGDLSMRTAWAARNLLDSGGQPLFSPADLRTLHEAALAACDLADGVRDGIIGDPLACRFDPRVTACRSGSSANCLTPAKIAAAARIYAGPTTSAGVPISTAGPFPGSELMWPGILEDVRFAHDFFRFALAESPRDGFPETAFDFDSDYKRLGLGGTFISSNPDLRRFARAGGKLLIVQGTNDTTEQAHAAIDYYEMVERVAGGPQAALGYARLFLVPGMNHCSGGDGAFAVDWFGAMERWAGQGRAPDMLVAAHVPAWIDNEVAIGAGLTAPAAGQAVTFTRPLYPYPLHAQYSGHGDVNVAASFRAAGG